MVKCYDGGVFLKDGRTIVPAQEGERQGLDREAARQGTIAYGILQSHNRSGGAQKLQISFDAMASHDITFVGIIQTARASGLERFPIPYVLTNCHNSLCAVGGTINEDDHMFGLSAAQKYGGVYVPPHIAVIHQYMREMYAGCGKMILGSDSHTRYGALGTMAVGEGGGELVKQLLQKTWDIDYPGVVAVYLTGKPNPGVGPQDVALAIIGAVYERGYVKNRVMEFVGDGIEHLSMDYRNGIDVMTTETTCLSSIWRTDARTKNFLSVHGRADEYKEMNPAATAYYDGMVYVDLSTVKPMIALPMHPSNVYEIEALLQNPGDILRETEKRCAALLEGSGVTLTLTVKIEGGRIRVDQGVVAGCAGGTYENLCAAASILRGKSCGNGRYALSVYPSSQPVMQRLIEIGDISTLIAAGATIRTAFCGPCFGAGDVPMNGGLSIRHTTRNFPNREGSKPANGQIASVALMDARSIAATSAAGGYLTPADALDVAYDVPEYAFDDAAYKSRIYSGWGCPREQEKLVFGPNIKDWPQMSELGEHLLLRIASLIEDPVTTTDELIPSGETSSFRSNPLGLAEFTLSRKDPAYVGRAKAVRALEEERRAQGSVPELADVLARARRAPGCEALRESELTIGSCVYAVRPGDGSAREQAASCQRVLGGAANIAVEYATKRYRSNLMNWGMIPFLMSEPPAFQLDDYILVPRVREAVQGDTSRIEAYVLGDENRKITLSIAEMTPAERQIILDGCLINHYRKQK